jgi:hypothetical protein
MWQIMCGYLIFAKQYLVANVINKFNGSQFGNNSCAKFAFHRFVWNKHECHSSTCVIWTLMSCTLFRHGCCMSIHVVYTWKSFTQFSCLNNAWHLCSNNTNLWNNKFCTYLKRTYEACKFVRMIKEWICICWPYTSSMVHLVMSCWVILRTIIPITHGLKFFGVKSCVYPICWWWLKVCDGIIRRNFTIYNHYICDYMQLLVTCN